MGEYPPASTIKPFIGLSALKEGIVDTNFSIHDPGYYKLDDDERKYRNWKRSGHGTVNLHRAIVVSNDTFFYTLAVMMGINSIHDNMVSYGFGQRTGLDIASERPGLIPSSEWKRKVKRRSWYTGETIISGTGQGYMLATPLQLAVSTCILANKGYPVKPRLAIPDESVTPLPISHQHSPEHWAEIISSLKDVVESREGTAHYRIGRYTNHKIAGKTGTAQVISIAQGENYREELLNEHQKDHGLFIAFSPIENPEIVVSVVVENESSSAPRVAKKVIDAYFKHQIKARHHE